MKCAWNELLSILPLSIRHAVDRLGKESLQELRLRLNERPELVLGFTSQWLEIKTTEQDISYIINTASRYSPWAASTASKGYITAPGGHRIGLCGDTVICNHEVKGIRSPTSLCVRIARDFPGIGMRAAKFTENLLILGPPGCGKTTLLRDLIRQKSEQGPGSVAVVDERGELFPICAQGFCFEKGIRTDVLTGCAKVTGIEMMTRTMGPHWIAVDEITAGEDCHAMVQAGWCGVKMMATAHAASVQDLLNRPIYKPLAESGLFTMALVLNRDKLWRQEEIPCCPFNGSVRS